MPKLETLIKIAAVGGIVTASTGYLFSYVFQTRIRKTKTYQKALDIVKNHAKTVEHLGAPIKEGAIKFGDSEENIRTFTVALKGTNTTGKLDCEVLITEPNKQPEITKLEIKFDDIPNKIFVIQRA